MNKALLDLRLKNYKEKLDGMKISNFERNVKISQDTWLLENEYKDCPSLRYIVDGMKALMVEI